MTSGQFHSIETTAIVVHRNERQRNDIGNISILADSIHRLGLIHPIVVTRDNVLVAGERRLAACVRLGHTHIASQYVDEVEPLTLRAIELEENVKRSNLTWQEECKAVYEFHEIQKKGDPTWAQADTERSLGLDRTAVSDRIIVARELIAGNPRVIEAPKFSTARGIIERTTARQNEETLLELRSMMGVTADKEEESVINDDFLIWAPAYTGPRFNFVHCDFPYGIGADTFNQGAAPTHGGYDDTASTYWNLCDCLAANLKRLTTDSCHFMFWFSMHYYQDTLDFFEKTDITFDPFPLVWLKSDNVGILPDPSRGPRRIYETALFGSRGDRKVVSAISNAYAAPTDRSQHMSIKPEPVLRNFFRMFVDESSLVLDPTCGSGSSLRAAESLNARYVLGIEVNGEFAEGANRSLRSSRALRRSKHEQKVKSDEGELGETQEQQPGTA